MATRPFVLPRLEPNDAGLLRAALDLYARVLMGQVERVPDAMASMGPWTDEQLRGFELGLLDSKEALGLPRHGSHGIYNPKVSPWARRAYALVLQIEGCDDATGQRLRARADEQFAAGVEAVES